MKRLNKQNDNVIFFVVFLILSLLNIIYILVQENFQWGFGGEYGNIARSIASGNGFSDPFGEPTGPSAWVAPLLPYLIAFFFRFFDEFTSYLILSVIKMISYAFSFVLISKSIRASGIKIHPVWLFCLFILYFMMFPNSNLKHIEDLWLNIFIISFFIYSITFYAQNGTRKYFIFLTISTMISSWINPSISFSMMAVLFFVLLKLNLQDHLLHFKSMGKSGTINTFLKSIYVGRFLKQYSIVVLFFLISLSIWSYRNYKVFNTFIPVKSNLWFEFYMSNIVDRDGELVWASLFKAHPAFGIDLDRLKEIGESDWIETYKDSSMTFIHNNPQLYFKKVKKRVFNAFIFSETVYDYDNINIYDQLSDKDIDILAHNKLIYEDLWISFDMDSTEFKTVLKNLNVDDRVLIYNDWKKVKTSIRKRSQTIPYIMKSIFLSVIPFIFIIGLACLRRTRNLNLFQASAIFYFVYLVPYILVSHHTRYQKTLFMIMVIIIYIGSVLLYEAIKSRLAKGLIKR